MKGHDIIYCFHSLPLSWSKEGTLSKGPRVSHNIGVKSAVNNIVAPPAWEVGSCQLQSQENDQCRIGQANVQTGRKGVVVLEVPVSPSLFDENTEEHTNNTVSGVVVWRGRWNVTGTREENRPVQPSNLRVWPLLQYQPVDNRQETQKEEEKNLVVDSTVTENSFWANNTPDDRSIEKDSTVWTTVVVLLVLVTQVVNSTISPSQNTHLHKGSPNGSEHLNPEHKTWGNLHVVTQFHVLGESNSLTVGDVTKSLEEHHTQWLTWNHVTNNELGDNVQTNCNICERIDNTNR